VKQRVIRAIQVQIAFIDFFPRRVENLNAANDWLDVFCKSNSDLARGCLYRAAYARFRALNKSVCFKPRQLGQEN